MPGVDLAGSETVIGVANLTKANPIYSRRRSGWALKRFFGDFDVEVVLVENTKKIIN